MAGNSVVNLWGAVKIFNKRFDAAFASYGAHTPRLKDMILAMLWIRLLGTVFILAGMLGALTCYYKMRYGASLRVRNHYRRVLEALFMITITASERDTASLDNIMQLTEKDYDPSRHQGITCVICLCNLADANPPN